MSQGRRLWKTIWRNRQNYVLLFPFFLGFFVFTVLPVGLSMVISLTDFNMLQMPHFVGMRNYLRLFLEDDIFIIALKNTVVFSCITGPLSYLMCFVFAWFINELGHAVRTVLTTILYVPSMCGNVFFIWSFIFSSDRNGLLNSLLIRSGILGSPISWLRTEAYVLPILMIVQLWLSLGTGFLAFIAGLQTVDTSLYEAGAVDGIRNRWQELWHITLPSMIPQLMFGAVMTITSSLAAADVSIALAGSPSVKYAGSTIVTHLMDYGNTRFEMGYASAIATLLFIIMVVSNKLVQRALRKVGQ